MIKKRRNLLSQPMVLGRFICTIYSISWVKNFLTLTSNKMKMFVRSFHDRRTAGAGIYNRT